MYRHQNIEFENPVEAGIAAATTPLSFVGANDHTYSFTSSIIGSIWFIAIVSLLAFSRGAINDTAGVKNYDIEVDGKRHNVTDYSGEYEIKDTGSVERGERWANNIITFVFCLVIFYILYNWIKGCFDSINLFFKVVIGGGIIYALYCWWDTIHSFTKPIIYISFAFCAIDFCLGVLVMLWIY